MMWFKRYNYLTYQHTTELGSNLSVSLQITRSAQGRLVTPPGSTSPTLLEQ